jgi:hypothetical protein
MTEAERRRILATWGQAAAWVTDQVHELRQLEAGMSRANSNAELRRRFGRTDTGDLDPAAPPPPWSQRHLREPPRAIRRLQRRPGPAVLKLGHRQMLE